MTGSRPAGPADSASRVSLERLWDRDSGQSTSAASSARGGRFPAPLRVAYGGELWIPLHRDRPTVIANFVSTLDGVVAFDTDGSSGGGEVSGFFDPDRFVMGLLRALADVVLVGAGTVRAAPTHEWTARKVHPASAALYATWRARVGVRRPQPTTIVVTARGELDPDHPGLSAPDVPVIVATTKAGAKRLESARLAPNVRVEVAGSRDRVAPARLLEIAGSAGAGLVLCEGGPHLAGDLVGEGLLDEVFLTVAPQIAGRADRTPRLGFVAGTAFSIADAPWADMVSVHRADQHLFLRYQVDRP
ncbi:MAG: dihydrofolate reductase family protein [Candidatus Limnocylindrales bacterium]